MSDALLPLLPTNREYDLINFYRDLLARNLSSTTASIYMRLVRQALREIPSPQREHIQNYLATKPRHSGFNSAWNAFARYAQGKGFRVDTITNVASASNAPTHPVAKEVVCILGLAFDQHYTLRDPIQLKHFAAYSDGKVFFADVRGSGFIIDSMSPIQIAAFNKLLQWGYGLEQNAMFEPGGNSGEQTTYLNRLELPLLIETPHAAVPMTPTRLMQIAEQCGDMRVLRRLKPAARASAPSASVSGIE